MNSADSRPPSEETYRATLQGRTTDGEPATIIVTRQGLGHAGRVWLTFQGALKATSVLTDQDALGLAGLLSDAAGTR